MSEPRYECAYQREVSITIEERRDKETYTQGKIERKRKT